MAIELSNLTFTDEDDIIPVSGNRGNIQYWHR
jgi:hypothetical protein